MGERRATWLAVTAVLPCAVLAVAPFLYMAAVALSDPGGLATALTALPFDRFLVNSLVLTGCAVAAQVLTSAMAAYAFARLRFPGRDRVFVGYLSVLLVPGVVLLVPRFLIVAGLGWIDTYQGLVSTQLVSVWGIFMLRQFFLTIPRDLEDAARLEGAGEWTIFWRIVLPLSRPALAALAVLAAADQWRSLLWPLIVTRSTEMRVLEVGLATFHGLHGSWPSQMAAALVVTAPMLVLYFVAQKYFVRGVELGVRRT